MGEIGRYYFTFKGDKYAVIDEDEESGKAVVLNLSRENSSPEAVKLSRIRSLIWQDGEDISMSKDNLDIEEPQEGDEE